MLVLVWSIVSVHSCPCKVNEIVFSVQKGGKNPKRTLSTPNRVYCNEVITSARKSFSLLDPIPERSPLFLLCFELILL